MMKTACLMGESWALGAGEVRAHFKQKDQHMKRPKCEEEGVRLDTS